jgi:hypothetical protein
VKNVLMGLRVFDDLYCNLISEETKVEYLMLLAATSDPR